MRTLYLFLFVCFSIGLHSQAFYKSMDPGSDWSSSNLSHIKSDNATPSAGYSASNSSPAASGGSSAVFYDCTPPSTTYSLTSPAISTIGKNNIRVGFGQRHTPAFTSAVMLEWSSNGSLWNSISSDVVSGSTSIWAVSLFDLPSTADNLLNLKFRFSFTTSLSATSNCPVGGNFKIDDFWVGSNFKLPIQLSSFSVTVMKYPILQWATLSEINCDHFCIERSKDGNYFSEISKIKNISAAEKKATYIYTDYFPYPGKNYYRLKQIDFDSSVVIFPVRSIILPMKNTAVYPTVFSNKIYLEIPAYYSKNCLWCLADIHGRILKNGIINTTNITYSIDLNMLDKGPYFFRLKSGENSELFKVIKI